MKNIRLIALFWLLSGFFLRGMAQKVRTSHITDDNRMVFTLSNDLVAERVTISDGILQGDELIGNKEWLAAYNNSDHGIFTDGDYMLEMMWTGWRAPGKVFNGDLQVTFTKKDYKFVHYDFKDADNDGRELELYFIPFDPDNTIQLKLTYQLLPGKFYSRRKISVEDTTHEDNWLQAFVCRRGRINEVSRQDHDHRIKEESSNNYRAGQNIQNSQQETTRIVKRGEFGQPCAADFTHGGVFFGIEYPASTNTITYHLNDQMELSCREMIGKVIRNRWIGSDWIVEGLAPDHYVKDWFYNYLPDIYIARNRPYALYNSWYDLRSPDFPGVQPDHVMNEKNILHIIDLFKKNMIEPYGIHLDAFVLDDGWDKYESDWQMRRNTFPHGIKPIVEALKPLGTTLGLWFGPTGGYSFRMKRIDWMKAHGYETAGHTPGDAMMDIAGPAYSALFEKRTTDLARDGVGYFKWDGIQFSSSEPENGHPVGYFSRRAALESLIAKCKAVRAVNPDEYLNITSGTWMSPWWLKFANQIWMQGADYGFADIPLVNERDGAVTYKDFVLYQDFHDQDVWFPVSNLMTHGIIKGNLENVGGNEDPLDKFTNDVVFYFGRGITMYELYISPDMLNADEWNVLSKSLAWAKDRFDILNKTYMIGGDLKKGETYGYVHFKQDSGIIAIRNPQMKMQTITVKLDPALGINASAANLVIERIYPTRWISSDLYSAGATVKLPLQGYEAAIYEVYPLKNADRPLLAGITFESIKKTDNQYEMHILKSGSNVKFLNPEKVSSFSINGENRNRIQIELPSMPSRKMLSDYQDHFSSNGINTTLDLDTSTVTARYILFLKPDSASAGKPFPQMILQVDGQSAIPSIQQQQGSWASYSFVFTKTGPHDLEWQLKPTGKVTEWSGTASIWLTGQQRQTDLHVTITTQDTIHDHTILPSPYGKGVLKKEKMLGTVNLQF